MATPSYGANTWFGFGEETTWGTAVARAAFLEMISSSLAVEKQIGSSRVARGLDPQRFFDQLVIARGDIVTELGYEGWLKLFKHLLGNTNTATLTAGQSYRHSFARQAALPTGLTIEVEEDQQNFLFTGCRIGQAVLRFAPDELPQVTWSFVGKSGSDNTGSESTPSFPSDLPVLPSDAALTIGGTDYSAYAQSVEITVGNALDGERRRIGSKNPSEAVRSSTRPDVTIRIEMEHNDATKQLVTDFLNGTEREFTLTYTDAQNIGSSTDKYLFKVECPACSIQSAFPAVNDPGILPLTIELLAKKSAAADFDVNDGLDGAIKVTIQNGESAI